MAASRRQRSKSVARSARREANREAPPLPPRTTVDSFQNLVTRTGLGTDNQQSFGSYGLFPITRLRLVLDFAYRSSWIVRAACQAVAEDMTREGFDLGSDMPPEEVDEIHTAFNHKFIIWDKIRETIQWARLYGGAGAYIMIDGQRPDTELRLETLKKGSFCGLLPLDRWLLNPSLTELVVDQRHSDYGYPKYYTTVGDSPLPPSTKIHHTRFLRFDGDDLPYYQKLSENLWTMSVLEPIWDRLLAFDSTTSGIAQLVNKAHIRNLYLKKWKEVVGTGGPLLDAQLAAIDWLRRLQQNEGISILDADDRFEALTYSFSGLDAVLMQMGQQLSGALRIPLVVLFGQSPAGLNSTGESDIKIYDDNIRSQQERKLRSKIEFILRIVSASIGIKLPNGFNWGFRPLRGLTDTQKATVGGMVTTQVGQMFDSGIIEKHTALKELKQSAKITGIFSNITDEEIKEAEQAPPQPGLEGEQGGGAFLPGNNPDEPDANEEPPQFLPGSESRETPEPSFLPGGSKRYTNGETDAGAFEEGELERFDRRSHKPIVHLHVADQNLPGRETLYAGHRVVVEVERGEPRYAGSSGGAIMAAPYGYFPGTVANDGDAVDVFLGENEHSNIVYVIDQIDPDTKKFHQPKVFLGFGKSTEVVDAFNQFYADGRGPQRIGKGREMSVSEFPAWLDKFKIRLSA